MKYKYIILKPNDVAYVFEDIIDDYGKEISVPTFRIENINGELCETLLPKFFILENDVCNVHINHKYNLLFSTTDTRDSIIIKKDKRSGEIGIAHHNNKKHHPTLSRSEYYDYVATVASCKFNKKVDTTDYFYYIDMRNNAIDICGLYDECVYDCNDEELVNLIFKELSTQRQKRKIAIKDEQQEESEL